MSLKDVVSNAMIIGLSGALLWHFSNIWRYGQYLIQEPNIVIRSLETAGLLIILIFGIVKYVSDVKRERNYRRIDNKAKMSAKKNTIKANLDTMRG